MSIVEGKVGYFANPGSQNSEKVIEIVRNRIKDDGIRTVVVASTLDLEVSFIDTSVGYEDSEERIGKAIVGRREHVIISTKTWAADKATAPRR